MKQCKINNVASLQIDSFNLLEMLEEVKDKATDSETGEQSKYRSIGISLFSLYVTGIFTLLGVMNLYLAACVTISIVAFMVIIQLVYYRANQYKSKILAHITSSEINISDDDLCVNISKEDLKEIVVDANRYMIFYHVIELLNCLSILLLFGLMAILCIGLYGF